MSLEVHKVQRPFRRLRRLLKRLPKDALAEDVHELRILTRRLEATVHALMLDRWRDGRRLLKLLAPIRKAAGRVRDMDVLVNVTGALSEGGEKDCIVRLLEDLGGRRVERAAELRTTLTLRRKAARRYLRRCSKLIEGEFEPAKRLNGTSEAASINATAVALNLIAELNFWPKLDEDNIHAFRVEEKELRYILQLGCDEDLKFLRVLDEVKDRIGSWHDWNMLARLSKELLDHGGMCALQKRIERTVKKKLAEALITADGMREVYIGSPVTADERGRSSLTLKEPVLRVLATLGG
jgi:CHAD domain-containing protein